MLLGPSLLGPGVGTQERQEGRTMRESWAQRRKVCPFLGIHPSNGVLGNSKVDCIES